MADVPTSSRLSSSGSTSEDKPSIRRPGDKNRPRTLGGDMDENQSTEPPPRRIEDPGGVMTKIKPK
ncbi:hypothetical protein [Cystobacter fuscus]|uniref:hypothetical protein n=1 Tax=Cystobacter fuscus TaxID=43 RepID=UPI002B2D9715|nr:hypothetical protein F0U63_27310 [Cystobacter fuscus]